MFENDIHSMYTIFNLYCGGGVEGRSVCSLGPVSSTGRRDGARKVSCDGITSGLDGSTSGIELPVVVMLKAKNNSINICQMNILSYM